MCANENIYVFRTNVGDAELAQDICRSLEQAGLASRATLDLEDCDRVLRVVSRDSGEPEIVQEAVRFGIRIESLD
jgi:hypothetical protein